MNYETYILVDYENVQDINTEIINGKIKMLIIVGENQKKIPVDLILRTQPFGDAIEWLQIRSYGKKNALDFFIVYFLGYYISQETENKKEFIIYSKDTGYDPLIEYLKKQGRNVKRIVSFKQLGNEYTHAENFNEKEFDEAVQKIIENLKKVAVNKRPKSKKGLVGHITSLLKTKNEKETDKQIEEMFIRGILHEENGRIKYKL